MRFIGITGGIGAGKSRILGYIRKNYKCEIYLADEVAHLVKQPGTKAYKRLVEILGEDILEESVSEEGASEESVSEESVSEKSASEEGAIEESASKESTFKESISEEGILGECDDHARNVFCQERQINKQAMAEKIFANPALLEQVNEIIHPAVREFLLEKLEAAKQAGEAELFFVEAALLIETGYLGLVDEMWYVYADEAVRRDRLRNSRGYSEEKITRIISSQLTEQRFRESCDFVIDNSGDFRESCRQIDERLAPE